MESKKRFKASIRELANSSDPEETDYLSLKEAFENYEESRILSIVNSEGIERKRYPGKHGKNQTALHLFVRFGRVKMAEHLIRLGADLNAQDDLGRTPLYDALTNNLTMMKLLLRNGADIDIPTKDGVLPLHIGLLYSPINEIVLLLNPKLASENAKIDEEYSKDLVELLLNCKYKLNLPISKYSTLLHFIIRNKDEKTLEEVLSKNMQFDINALNFENESLLHVAVKQGKKEIVEILLNFGFEVDVRGPLLRTPLHFAAEFQKFELIETLLSHRADINLHYGTSGAKIIHILWEILKREKLYNGINDEDIEKFRLLLRNGYKINPGNDYDKLMIKEVTERRVWKLVDMLMRHGAMFDLEMQQLTDRLETAICREHYDIIELILTHSWQINFLHGERGTPIHVCLNNMPDIILNRVDMIEFLASCGVDFNETSNIGKTALHLATENSFFLEVRCLIELGADVNGRSDTGEIPLLVGWNLYFAKDKYEDKYDRLKIVELLLSNGGDVNYGLNTDHSNIPPLQQALLSKSLKGIQLILDKRYNVPTLNEEDSFEISRKVVEFLLNRNINCSLPNNKYSTLLHFSVVHGDKETFNLVLQKCTNFDINAYDMSGQTLLHHALEKKRESFIDVLVQLGACVNLQDRLGRTSIHYAVMSRNSLTVDYLMNHGGDSNFPDNNGHTPLHYSIWYENIEIVVMLLSRGADIRIKSFDGMSPLHFCCGRSKLTELLSVNSARNTGEEDTAPHQNAEVHFIFNKSIMKLLMERGADANASSFRGRTPLSEASLGGALDIVAFLLENGANVELPGEEGETPLMKACRGGHLEIVDLLLSKGADLHQVDGKSNNLLHFAVLASETYVAELLLRKGFDVNSKNAIGFTPLNHLCETFEEIEEMSKLKMIELLVDYQADIYVVGSQNMTLADFAILFDELNIAEYLQDLNVAFTNTIFQLDDVNIDKAVQLAVACMARKGKKIEGNVNSNVHYFYEECCDELLQAKEIRVSNTSMVTFYNFLTDDLRVLTPVWENDQIMNVFESVEYKNDLPIYGDILEMRISRIKKLSVFIKETKNFLEKYSRNKLPNLVCDQLFSFLRYQDFRCMMRALFPSNTKLFR